MLADQDLRAELPQAVALPSLLLTAVGIAWLSTSLARQWAEPAARLAELAS